MGSARTKDLLRHLHQLAADIRPAALSDRELIQRFAAQADEDAFAALLARHGPLVFSACRRVLPSLPDAEDVFQATFLLLARKAAALRRWESVGSWLYGVAYRLALNVRARAARRARHEARLTPATTPDPAAEVTLREAQAVLDAELSRLPERYRAPLVLCCLEGLARDEAARQLGWPLGTLKSRLERGRQLLRGRLVRRGLTLPAAFAAALVGHAFARADLPGVLVRATLRGALGCTGKAVTGGDAPSQAAVALAEGMARAMAATRLKWGAALLMAAGMLAVGAGLLVRPAVPPDPPRASPVAARVAPPAAGEDAAARTDRRGDPLPEEAIARLGTTCLRHGGSIFFLRFTPDSKTLVSQGHDGVRVWDAASGRQRHFFPWQSAKLFGANASLSADGKRVAMPAKEGIVIRDVETGKLVRTLSSRLCSFPCFSPDGGIVAANDKYHGEVPLVVLWDAASGTELRSWHRPDARHAVSAFTPDGKLLITHGPCTQASGRPGYCVELSEVGTGKAQRRIDLPSVDMPRIALSPDGTALAAILYTDYGPERQLGAYIRLYDVASGRELRQLGVKGKGKNAERWSYLSALAFAPDGKAVYVGGTDETVIAWDPRTGKELRRVGRGLIHPLALAVSPDNKRLAAVSAGTTIRLFDLDSGKEVFPAGDADGSQLTHVALSEDGRRAVTAEAGRVHIWDLTTARRVGSLTLKQGHSLQRIWLSRDGGELICSGRDEREKWSWTVRAWDLTTCKETYHSDWRLRDRGRPLELAPDGKTLACVQRGKLALFDWRTGKELGGLPEEAAQAAGAAFIPGGRLLTWDQARLARLWNLAEGREIRRFTLPKDRFLSPYGQEASPQPYKAVTSPDGRYLAYASQQRFLALYDVTAGEAIWKTDNLPDWPSAMAFSPDGRALAWGGPNHAAVHLVELATGRERHRLRGHRGAVSSLAFSADGKTLVSASRDTTALVWNLSGPLPAKSAGRKPLSPAELAACWADLAGADAATAYRAVRRLAAFPAEAAPYVRQRLRPVLNPDEDHLARLLRDLASPRFAERDKATQELQALGEVASEACRKALAAATSLELRRRLETILAAQRRGSWTPGPDGLRALRAVEVLELAGTAEARAVLRHLAEGAPAARLTREAQGSLRRLTARADRSR